MGTHPIFESDFDCLTDTRINMNNDTSGRSVEKRRKLKNPKNEKSKREGEKPNSSIKNDECMIPKDLFDIDDFMKQLNGEYNCCEMMMTFEEFDSESYIPVSVEKICGEGGMCS